MNDFFTGVLPWLLWVGRIALSAVAVLLLIRCGRTLLSGGKQESWGFLSLSNGARYPLYHWENMIGRAKLALKETSTELRGRLRYAVYDDAIRRQLFREKHLENIMGAALQNREFQVYLQPDRKRNHQRRRGAGSLDERRRHDLSRRVHPAVRKERVHHPAGPLGV